jgi:hypothetical protein
MSVPSARDTSGGAGMQTVDVDVDALGGRSARRW